MPSALLVVLVAINQQPLGESYEARVVGVTQGDTLTLHRGPRSIQIRLHGVDCPEDSQAFGNRSNQRTADLVLGKTVTIRVVGQDRHGKTLAEVILADGRSLNRELVREGLAWNHAPDIDALQDLQAEAKAAKRGLWSDPHPVSPWQWRASRNNGVELPPDTVIGNRTSKTYHSPTCHSAAKIAEKHRMVFENATKAQGLGYHRAGDCL